MKYANACSLSVHPLMTGPCHAPRRHHEPFTLDGLAVAMRGKPRSSLIMVKTEAGLRPVVLVSGGYVGVGTAPPVGTPYTIVLEVGEPQAQAPLARRI
jgi:hypothetical protein